MNTMYLKIREQGTQKYWKKCVLSRVRARGVGAIRVGGERGEIVGVGREEERFETVGRMGVRAAAVDGGEGMGRCGGHGCTLLKNVAAPA